MSYLYGICFLTRVQYAGHLVTRADARSIRTAAVLVPQSAAFPRPGWELGRTRARKSEGGGGDREGDHDHAGRISYSDVCMYAYW